jgi:3-deoxy-manno-octulosonate cytidylyltransferase (CMP-KDO synthetase)
LNVLGVIPARLGAERLPRKPLLELAGRPLIEWVWRRAATCEALTTCVVATDSDEIARVCAGFGATVVATRSDHASGTDRVAEVANMPDFAGHDIIVNIQGDEPFVEPQHVAAALAEVRRGSDIGTVATPVGSRAAWHDPAVVKVTRRDDGNALYFSRAPIPHRRAGDPDDAELRTNAFLRHVGLYAFRRVALARWVELPIGVLEQLERLEQLRALAAGLSIGVAVVPFAEPGIDTPADVRRAEVLLGRTTAG